MTSILLRLVPLSILCAPTALAQETATPPKRPSYAFLRQMEDWSEFRAPASGGDYFDPIKHIDLSDDGDVWVSFGGRVEARFESWHNFGFARPNDDNFTVSRALLHGDLHAGDHFRLYVEGKTAQSTDRDLPGGRRTLDMDTLALQQAFVDLVLPLGDSTLTVRPGRQMLLFGGQRLISPLPWGNTLRTWDGVTAEWRTGSWSITGLATAYVPVDKTDFNEADEDTTLYGIYAKRAPSPGGRGLEVYAIGNERSAVTVNGTTGDERRHTFGARTWGPVGDTTDFEAEGAWQTGEVGDGDVSAWFLSAQGGWRLTDGAGKPRLWLGLDAASGDDEFGGDVETFHQLFPLGHAYFGYIDAIGRQNIFDASVGSQWSLGDATALSLGYHLFRLMETSDSLYNAGGAAYRSGFTSRDVGSEIDLLVNRKFGRHLKAYLGYSHFFAGDAISESGPDEDVDFAYFGMSFTF